MNQNPTHYVGTNNAKSVVDMYIDMWKVPQVDRCGIFLLIIGVRLNNVLNFANRSPPVFNLRTVSKQRFVFSLNTLRTMLLNILLE